MTARPRLLALGFSLALGPGFWLGSAGLGLAQVTAPLQVPPIERVVPPAGPKFAPARPELPAPPPVAPSGPALQIDAVKIEGVTAYPEGTFNGLSATLIGAAIPESKLAEALQAIQFRYNRDGYILSTVRGSIEPAEGKNTLVIRVVEGFISEVKLEGNIGSAGLLVYRYLSKLKEIRPINIADLERYLLLAQDVPGVGVRAVLRRATGEAGAVELVAQLSRRAFGGYASYDNRGSDFAGPSEVLIGAVAQSFTTLGERLEAQFFNTLSGTQLFGQVSGQAFIGSEGLRLQGYIGRGNSQPGSALAITGYNGDILVAGLGLSYPVIRTRALSLSLAGNFDIYQSSVDLRGPGGVPQRQSDSHLRVLRGSAQLTTQDTLFGGAFPGADMATLGIHKGIPGLGSSSNQSSLPPRPGNRVDFLKFTGEISRLQNLFRIGDISTALLVTISGQYTDAILPPSEKFYLGGNRFGRGFYSGEVTGDRALGTSTEFQVNTALPNPLPILGGGDAAPTQFYVFYDVGESYDLAPGDLDRELQSAGLGARINLTDQISTELEGTRRFTRRPNGANATREDTLAFFGRIVARY